MRQDGYELQPAHEIYADVVADAVRARHRPSGPLALAVPGWWTQRAVDLVNAAVSRRGIDGLLMVNDAEAAVLEHRAHGGSLPDTVAVVSLRAEHAGVVLVRHCHEQPTALRSPTLMHAEGGNRLDAAILNHLVRGLVDLGDPVDREDPRTIAAAHHALDQCRKLREALSVSAVESVPLRLPNAERRLRLVRSELDELATRWVDAVTGMVRAAVEQCPEPVETVLLVGGLAAMPLVGQRLSADLGAHVAVADEPTLVVARGAGRLSAPQAAPAEPRTLFSGWRRTSRQPNRRGRHVDIIVPPAAPTDTAQSGATEPECVDALHSIEVQNVGWLRPSRPTSPPSIGGSERVMSREAR